MLGKAHELTSALGLAKSAGAAAKY
jgi:hypothetical protein